MSLWRVLTLLICLFLPCFGLRCTNNCSYTSSLSTPFQVPISCNQMISAGKCSVVIEFWYNREEYVVTFTGQPSTTVFSIDNRRSVLLGLPSRHVVYRSFLTVLFTLAKMLMTVLVIWSERQWRICCNETILIIRSQSSVLFCV
jgi:hypothetical protein